jgi:filamentous hemagglutinin
MASTAGQVYRAASGANPISGATPSTGEQVLWGASAILNGLGIYGAVVEGAAAKGSTSIVTAEGRIGNSVYTDVNQTARPAAQANPNQPTLIADRVDAKVAANGKPHPNGNMADAHAEIGVIQQAYNAGKTTGADMTLKVEGKAVCTYCRGDIAAAAEKAGLHSLQINEAATGKTLYWRPGMRSLRELN